MKSASSTALSAALSTLVIAGCGADVAITEHSRTDAGSDAGEWMVDGRVTGSNADKIDLLLMIDNSRRMAEKQQILAAALPDLIRGLTSPPCISADGSLAAQQPAGPLDPCPDPATRRRFRPIADIHIGVISSSIGGHGSDACPASETYSCPNGAANGSNNDEGHLITRSDPCDAGTLLTYQGKGFLAWDPAGKANTPPGESQLGAVGFDATTGAVTTVSPGLLPQIKDLVLGAGEIGCGYEASLESWYRFLVDPDPHQTITVDPATQKATPQGIDDVLLQQRKDFLRSSSLLAIIGLSDENDCSIKEYGQFYFAAQQRDPGNPNQNFYLPKARSECATNPNDKCCLSTGQATPPDCPPEPQASLDAKTDDVNLRCFDQKRRFGIDFLYPIERYVAALTQPLVPNRMGDMVPNPIFSDIDPSDEDTFVRDPSMVYLSYIVGVPWQDIARQGSDGKPDLIHGLDIGGKPSGGFKSAGELSMPDADGHTVWDYIIGDPAAYVTPLDPHMRESTWPRMGSNPVTGDTIAPPSTAPGPGPNAINGHEYTTGTNNGVQQAPDDLQHACIFPLPEPRDCTDPSLANCECTDPKNDNPLCEPVNPNDPASPRTRQVRTGARPGIRQLAAVKALGEQGIVGSICAASLDDPGSPTFGYRPAIASILDRIGDRLDVRFGGICYNTPHAVDAAGHIACAMVEARNTGQKLDGAACDAFCNAQPGRVAVPPAHAALRTKALTDPSAEKIGADCVCEIEQLSGPQGCSPIASPLAACQCDPWDTPAFQGKPVDGWCYVDATTSPPIGNPALAQKCTVGEERVLRFVGAGTPVNGAVVFVTCSE